MATIYSMGNATTRGSGIMALDTMFDGIADIFKTERKYTVKPVKGRLAVTLPIQEEGTMHIGNIVDAPYFASEWYSPWQIDILNTADEIVQRISKLQGPRRHSALFGHSHICSVVEQEFAFARQAGVKLDFPTTLMGVGHDQFEDDQEIGKLTSEWEKANIEGDHERRKKLEDDIAKKRVSLRDDYVAQLFRIVERSSSLSDHDKSTTKKHLKEAASGIYHLTRFVEQATYAHSIDFQYKRQGREHLLKTMRRIFVKNCDTVRNNLEVGPLEKEVMTQIRLAFNDDMPYGDSTVGKALTERFGALGKKGVEMSRTRRLRRGFSDMLKVHAINQFQNTYASRIFGGQYGADAKEMYPLIVASKDGLIFTSYDILRSAKKMYEQESYVRKNKGSIDRNIEEAKKHGSYYLRVTDDGTIRPMIRADAMGQDHMDKQDAVENGFDSGMLLHYRAVRDSFELLKLFRRFNDKGGKEPKTASALKIGSVAYDPQTHDYHVLRNFRSIALDGTADMWSIRPR